MKYEVYELNLDEDDVLITSGLTEREAQKMVDESPKTRVMYPSVINGS